MSSTRNRGRVKKPSSPVQMDQRLSKRLMKLMKEVAQQGASVDLKTTIDNKEVNVMAKKEGNQFHLSFEVPEEKNITSETSSNPKSKPIQDTTSEDSAPEVEEVKTPRRQSSRRSGERVTWKRSGGTLEKVVVKREQDTTDLSEESTPSPKAKRARKEVATECEGKAKGKGKGKKSATKSEVKQEEPAKKPRGRPPKKKVEEQPEKSITADASDTLEDKEKSQDAGSDEQTSVEEEVEETPGEVKIVKSEPVEEEAANIDETDQGTKDEGNQKEAQKDQEEVDKMMMEIPIEMLLTDLQNKESEAGQGGENVTETLAEPSTAPEDGSVESLQAQTQAPDEKPKSKRGRKIAVKKSEDGFVTVAPRGKKRAPRPQDTCNMCGKTYLVDNMDRHKRYQCKSNPDRVPLFKCNHCLFSTESQEELDKHTNIHPPDFKPRINKNCVCEVCSIELETMKAKLHHEWKTHNYFGMRVAYNCEFCGKRYPTKWQYDEHVGYHLDRKNFMCDSCGKKFRSKQEVKDHQKYGHIEDIFKYQCRHCRIGIRTAEEYAVHECKMVAELIQQKGFRGVNQVVYVQEFDEEETTEEALRQEEVAVSAGGGDADKVIIVDKVKDSDGKTKLADEEDDESDTDEMVKELKESVKAIDYTETEQNRAAATCAQTSGQAEGKKEQPTPRIFFDLQSIAAFQTGTIRVSERYMCEYCGELFITKVQKYTHRKVTHGYRKLPKELRKEKLECEICGKRFVYKDSLKKHYVHTHCDERRYPCHLCDKSFKRPTDRQYHVNTIHNNQFKFFCSQCGHGVHRKHYLKNHQCNRVHRLSKAMMGKSSRSITKAAAAASRAMELSQSRIIGMKANQDGSNKIRLVVENQIGGEQELVGVSGPLQSGAQQVQTAEDLGMVMMAAEASSSTSVTAATATATQEQKASIVDAASIVESGALADILPKNESEEEQKWIIQHSSDGQQILVIQAGLANAVEDGEQIVVEATDDTGAQEVAQICQAAAILTGNMGSHDQA